MAQNNQRNDFTSCLIEKYIKAGMNVLDVGCGNGEISFLIADAVGDEGNVNGIDINPAAIESALVKKEASGKQNIRFSVSDFNAHGGEKYDVVFGRRVLMYQPDAHNAINVLKRMLKPEGIMLFQESDEMGSLLNGDCFPIHNMVQDWIWETVRREGGNTHIGSELYGIMKAAGMCVVDYCSESILQTAETGSDLSWVVTMMYERMKALGIHAQMEGLEDRLKGELQNADRAFVRDLAFGICVRKD